MDINELNPVAHLDDDACWELLLSTSFGRLATSIAGLPDIFPVNFIAVDKKIVFRTAEGSKLLELTINDQVAFETDGIGREEAWSVVVKGHARKLDTMAEIEEANELPLRPLVPTLKYIFVEITPVEVTGRRFHLGPEPERY